MMNIAVLQFYTSNINYGVYSEMINQKYCEDKGYTYVCEKNTERITSICDERSFHWGKVKLVQELMTLLIMLIQTLKTLQINRRNIYKILKN
jgi:hypothetical protein